MTFILTIETTSAELALWLVKWTLTRDYTVVGILEEGYDDDLTDDETAEDIGKLMDQREGYITTADNIMAHLHVELDEVPDLEQRIEMWRIAQPNFSHSNAVMRAIDAEIADLQAVIDQRADNAPPHGIPRPITEMIDDHQARYWVDRTKSPTQGSGSLQRGLESVPCETCGASQGEVCIAGSHGPYRKGYGHKTRREAHRAMVRGTQS